MNKKKKIAIAVIFIIVVVIVAAAAFYAGYFIVSEKKKSESLDTVSVSALEKILEVSELSTVEYTYNSIAQSYDSEKQKVKYYVSYEGTVECGIDFEKIKIKVDEESKKVGFVIPEVEIQDVRVDMGTLSCIFENKKYEAEDISQEAYKISLDDLKQKAENDEKLFESARENAAASVQALFEPWLEQIDENYTVEVR